MRIVTVLTSLGVGGAEKQALAVAERMAKRGHAVALVVLRPRLAGGMAYRASGRASRHPQKSGERRGGISARAEILARVLAGRGPQSQFSRQRAGTVACRRRAARGGGVHRAQRIRRRLDAHDGVPADGWVEPAHRDSERGRRRAVYSAEGNSQAQMPRAAQRNRHCRVCARCRAPRIDTRGERRWFRLCVAECGAHGSRQGLSEPDPSLPAGAQGGAECGALDCRCSCGRKGGRFC